MSRLDVSFDVGGRHLPATALTILLPAFLCVLYADTACAFLPMGAVIRHHLSLLLSVLFYFRIYICSFFDTSRCFLHRGHLPCTSHPPLLSFPTHYQASQCFGPAWTWIRRHFVVNYCYGVQLEAVLSLCIACAVAAVARFSRSISVGKDVTYSSMSFFLLSMLVRVDFEIRLFLRSLYPFVVSAISISIGTGPTRPPTFLLCSPLSSTPAR